LRRLRTALASSSNGAMAATARSEARVRLAQASADELRRLVRALRDSGATAQQAVGVSGAQLFVLRQLSQGAGLSISELAQRTLTHQSSVSVVAQRLVDAGLCLRARGADARRVELRITAKGKQLLGRAPEPFQERIMQALQRLPGPVAQQLAEGLAALGEELGLAEEEPAMLLEEPAPARKRR
jgi:DNA-binding MarR family transcriptional regulator